MKHIIAYPLWEAWRPKEVNPIQQEFIRLFLAKCDELGIQINNLATDLQKKNNTYIINLAPSDVLKLFLDSGWQQHSSGIRKGKAVRLAKSPSLELFKEIILSMDKPTLGTAHWIIANDNIRQMIGVGRWWTSTGPTAAQHSSQRSVIFGEMQNAEEALGRFFNELVLVLTNVIYSLDSAFKGNRTQYFESNGLFSKIFPTQLKGLIKGYPDFSWKQLLGQVEMPDATFKAIIQDPGFSEDLKKEVLNNPNYSSYEKVEDILGDWG